MLVPPAAQRSGSQVTNASRSLTSTAIPVQLGGVDPQSGSVGCDGLTLVPWRTLRTPGRSDVVVEPSANATTRPWFVVEQCGRGRACGCRRPTRATTGHPIMALFTVVTVE